MAVSITVIIQLRPLSVKWIFVLFLGLTGSEAGLAITSALGLTEMFQWDVRQSARMENQMTSVERIVEHSKLPSEAPLDSEKGLHKNSIGVTQILNDLVSLNTFVTCNRPSTFTNLASRRIDSIRSYVSSLFGGRRACIEKHNLFHSCQGKGERYSTWFHVYCRNWHSLDFSVIQQNCLLYD